MTVERDIDRRLRAWVAEGVDRVPERFVWAALDEIELTPQRSPWRSRLDRLVARVRPPVALAGSAAAVVAALVVYLAVAGPNIDGSGRQLEAADLPGIVVWQDTMPATWTLDNLVSNPTEVRLIPIRSVSPTELPNPPGLVAGRYTNFSGPDSIFMSWALLFERSRDASAALPLYRHELEDAAGWGLGAPIPVVLGEDASLYQGATTALMGPPTGEDPVPAAVYLWRNGNVLLALGGWFSYDAAQLRSLAEAMDARAEAATRSAP